MPKKLEIKLKKSCSKKLTPGSKRWNACVYGTLHKITKK